MSFFDTFNNVDSIQPFSGCDDTSYEPKYEASTPSNWESEFSGIKSTPVYYNLDGFISPYASNNWGLTTSILQTVVDESRLPALTDKVDPNRIFTADIAALRNLASEQQKITKVFEKKLVESLTDRGKFGLDENDIAAMQALTSARSTIASINKEQINVKKNIAEMKIKQQSMNNSASASSSSSNNDGYSGKGQSSMDIGRSILDNIFDTPTVSTQQISNNDYTNGNGNSAGDILDELIGSSTVTKHTQYENVEPTTYVCLGQTDEDIEFQTYAANGSLIPDYPNPNANITKIDRDAGVATDELLVQYPIKNK